VEDAAGEVEVLSTERQRDCGRGKGEGGKGDGKGRTAVTTVLFANRPLKISTLEPLRRASTRWPPVTLAYVSFVRRVGRNWDVFVKADAG
jgi:hypothetical protein